MREFGEEQKIKRFSSFLSLFYLMVGTRSCLGKLNSLTKLYRKNFFFFFGLEMENLESEENNMFA